MSRKKAQDFTADVKFIGNAMKAHGTLSPKTIKRIEAGLKKFFGVKRRKTT